jgi:hypothetical protein
MSELVLQVCSTVDVLVLTEQNRTVRLGAWSIQTYAVGYAGSGLQEHRDATNPSVTFHLDLRLWFVFRRENTPYFF